LVCLVCLVSCSTRGGERGVGTLVKCGSALLWLHRTYPTSPSSADPPRIHVTDLRLRKFADLSRGCLVGLSLACGGIVRDGAQHDSTTRRDELVVRGIQSNPGRYEGGLVRKMAEYTGPGYGYRVRRGPMIPVPSTQRRWGDSSVPAMSRRRDLACDKQADSIQRARTRCRSCIGS
jgi:hypothetical protein